MFQGVIVQGLEALMWGGVWLRWNVADAAPTPGGVLVALVVLCVGDPITEVALDVAEVDD